MCKTELIFILKDSKEYTEVVTGREVYSKMTRIKCASPQKRYSEHIAFFSFRKSLQQCKLYS